MSTWRRVCCCLFAAVAAVGFAARAADYDLPDGYIPVPYIESTGAQSVPIGYSPTKNTALEFAFTTLTYNDGDTFFGASWGGTAYLLTEQNNKFCFWLQSSYTQVGGTFKTNTDYSFTVANGTSTMTTAGEEPYVVENLPLNNSYGSLCLFGFPGSAGHRCKYRFKRMKVWNSAGGTLKRDLVPCIQKGEGGTLTAGVYDLANEEFYTDTIKTTPFKTGELWFEVGDVPPQEYDGITPCCPEPMVTHQLTGAVMQKGVDYELSYENNDRPGTATVTIQGIGKYVDVTVTRTFTMVAKKFRLQFAQAIPDRIFDGVHAVEPREFITIIDGEAEVGTPLTEGEDYELEFRDNDRIGVAKVVARGKNAYEGETAVTLFNIIHDPALPPDGYVRLQSITADGQQTISTGFMPDANTIVTNCLFCYTARPPAPIGGCLFGGSFGSEGFILEWQEQNGKQSLVWFGSRQVFCETDPIGHEMEFSIGPAGDGTRTATLVVDGGERQVFTGLSTKQSGALSLFSANGGGNRAAVRFYRTTFMSSSTTVARDFVPALRLADNKVGVYDMANSKFYPNEGTSGDFQAGPSLVTNMVISSVEDVVTEPEHPYRPPVTVTLEGSDEPLTEGVDYRLVWPETKNGLVYLYALGIGKYNGAYASTSYRQFIAEPFDEWLSSTTIPTFTTNIGCRHVYVFDYTDAGKTLLALRQTMTLGDALVVGGGGAGGWTIGGGGGGGGVLQIKCSHPLTAGQGLSLSVGAGGPLDLGTDWAPGNPGTASSLDVGVTNYVAFGGGGGGTYKGAPTATGNLASAGGYGDEATGCVFTDGVHYSSSQGNPGGTGSAKGSGGGGGAGLGQSGGNGVNGLAGNGGEGVLSGICGYPVFQGHRAVYGSGGGGGAGNKCATPGRGGANAGYGSASGSKTQGDNAVNGFGGGGGGGSYSGSGTKGGAGGHGRVILSFFAGDTSGKMLAVEPLEKTLSANPRPRVYDPSDPAKVLRPGVDFRYEWKTNNPRATRENPGQGVVVAVGLGDYEGVSADTWYDYFRPDGFMLMIR